MKIDVVRLVGVVAVLGPRLHDRAVLVDRVVEVDARHQFEVVAVVAPRLVHHAVEDVLAVLQVPHLGPQAQVKFALRCVNRCQSLPVAAASRSGIVGSTSRPIERMRNDTVS